MSATSVCGDDGKRKTIPMNNIHSTEMVATGILYIEEVIDMHTTTGMTRRQNNARICQDWRVRVESHFWRWTALQSEWRMQRKAILRPGWISRLWLMAPPRQEDQARVTGWRRRWQCWQVSWYDRSYDKASRRKEVHHLEQMQTFVWMPQGAKYIDHHTLGFEVMLKIWTLTILEPIMYLRRHELDNGSWKLKVKRDILHEYDERPQSESRILAKAIKKYLRHRLPDWTVQ